MSKPYVVVVHTTYIVVSGCIGFQMEAGIGGVLPTQQVREKWCLICHRSSLNGFTDIDTSLADLVVGSSTSTLLSNHVWHVFTQQFLDCF